MKGINLRKYDLLRIKEVVMNFGMKNVAITTIMMVLFSCLKTMDIFVTIKYFFSFCLLLLLLLVSLCVLFLFCVCVCVCVCVYCQPLLKWKWPGLNTIDFKVIDPFFNEKGFAPTSAL